MSMSPYNSEAPPIDSLATMERVERIAGSLADWGIAHDVLRNRWEEPLGIIIDNALPVHDIAEIAEAALDQDYRPDNPLPQQVGNVLPLDYHSGRVLPSRMLNILDAVVQGAVGRRDMRAIRLGAAATGPWVGDAYPHFDLPGAQNNYTSGLLQGLNVHLTLGGNGAARLGQLRSWEQIDRIARMIRSRAAANIPRITLDSIIGAELEHHPDSALTPWFSTLPGDAVIFQAAAQRPDHLPIAHEFMSTSRDRRIIVITPEVADEATVLAARRRAAQMHDIMKVIKTHGEE